MTWPWPDDDRLQRRSRVAQMYRDRLMDADAAACAEVDALMALCGQRWILEQHTDSEELLTVRELAAAADVTPMSARSWIHRWSLECRGHDALGRQLYRWGDVVEHRRSTNRTS